MKPLELTPKHKKRLLKMCNKLYKREDLTFYTHTPDGLNKKHIFIIGFIGNNDFIPDCDVCMHWYEFCFNKLLPTLALKACKTDIVMDIEYTQNVTSFTTSILLDNLHPINFLYKEFKKLNATK